MILLVISTDKIGQRLLAELAPRPDIIVVTDRSGSLGRVLRLVLRGSLKFSDLAKMLMAELKRPGYPNVIKDLPSVRSNDELLALVRELKPDAVYLFRAGLIVERKVLQEVPVYNFHCASVVTHGGLAAIRRALDDRAVNQTATLHRVVTTIDSGEVIAVKPYVLDPERSYAWNEDVAYAAGIELAKETLGP